MMDISQSIDIVLQFISGLALGRWFINNLWRLKKCSICNKLMKTGYHLSITKNGKSKHFHCQCIDFSKKLEDQI